MARIRDTVASAMADVSSAAIEGKNTAKWASEICDKVWREGVTVTVLGIPIGVQLGAPDDEDAGPIIKRLRKLFELFEEPKP